MVFNNSIARFSIGLFVFIFMENSFCTDYNWSANLRYRLKTDTSDDVEEIAKKASEHGTHIHAGPTEWSIRGQNGKMKHFLGLFLFDPDGYFYEINQLVREE